MEAVAVQLNMTILSLILVALLLAIIFLGAGLLADARRSKTKPRLILSDNFEDALRVVEATPPVEDTPPKTPASAEFSRPAPQPPASRPGKVPGQEALPTAKIAFSTIQSEIRAALEAASQTTVPAHSARTALLNWAESGKLAVLSLGDAPPASAWPLLQAQGIRILIVQEDHPFPPPDNAIELLCLRDQDTASLSPLITKLRARLAQGEPVAFHTESGLTGTAAFLAARLSSRRPG